MDYYCPKCTAKLAVIATRNGTIFSCTCPKGCTFPKVNHARMIQLIHEHEYPPCPICQTETQERDEASGRCPNGHEYPLEPLKNLQG